MGTGQSILTVFAMLLLSTLMLRVNSTLLNSGNVVTNSKLGLTAIALAQSRLEEIKSKAFDQNTVSAKVSATTGLTSASQLGPETGEVYPNFNDVDDFNGFTYTDTVQINPDLAKSATNCYYFKEVDSVVYVSSTSPDVTSSSQTWNKKITVKITIPQMTDTIKVSTVFSYFVFR
jgi:hypothetical protein